MEQLAQGCELLCSKALGQDFGQEHPEPEKRVQGKCEGPGHTARLCAVPCSICAAHASGLQDGRRTQEMESAGFYLVEPLPLNWSSCSVGFCPF